MPTCYCSCSVSVPVRTYLYIATAQLVQVDELFLVLDVFALLHSRRCLLFCLQVRENRPVYQVTCSSFAHDCLSLSALPTCLPTDQVSYQSSPACVPLPSRAPKVCPYTLDLSSSPASSTWEQEPPQIVHLSPVLLIMNDRNRLVPASEVKELIDDGKLIVIYEGYALKLDSWIDKHPGGRLAILHMVGRDASDEINV